MGPCAVVTTACLESRHSRARAPLYPSSFKETKYFRPAHSAQVLILWGASVTKGKRALPRTARARISDYVSGRQGNLIHLTTLRRFSRPILAYKCGLKPHSFHLGLVVMDIYYGSMSGLLVANYVNFV